MSYIEKQEKVLKFYYERIIQLFCLSNKLELKQFQVSCGSPCGIDCCSSIDLQKTVKQLYAR